MTDLPPYKNLVPEILKLGVERNTRTWIRGSLHVLILLLLPFGAPLNLEVLDGVASGMTSCLIHIAIGVSCISHIRLEVDGSVIDVLVGIRLVRKLEALPKL